MEHLSPLQVKLLDEYYRYERCLKDHQEHIKVYCKGTLHKKIKNDHLYYYLVWREDKKIKTKYVKEDDVVKTQVQIERRQLEEKSCKEMKFDMKIIEKALGKELIDEYRERL